MTAASAPAATDAGEKAPRRLDSLTGLRFLAALVVVCSHLPAALGLRGRILLGSVDEELALGGAGVLFFFLLSGFVLCWSRRAGDRPLDFYGRRFARIYPNVVVAVGVTAVVYATRHQPFSPRVLATVLGLLQAWVPREGVYYAIIAVTWTLSVEAFFYAVFPHIVGPLARLRPGQRRALAAVAIALVVGRVLVLHAAASNPIVAWGTAIAPPARLPEFVLGILLALELRSLPTLRLDVGLALAVLGCAAAVQIDPNLIPLFLIVPVAWVVVAAAQRDLSGRGSLFSRAGAVLLGTWSYALYLAHVPFFFLVHTPVQHALARIVPDGSRISWPLGAAVFLAGIGLSVLVAAALYAVVERPAERWLRPRLSRLASSRRPGSPTAGTTVDAGEALPVTPM